MTALTASVDRVASRHKGVGLVSFSGMPASGANAQRNNSRVEQMRVNQIRVLGQKLKPSTAQKLRSKLAISGTRVAEYLNHCLWEHFNSPLTPVDMPHLQAVQAMIEAAHDLIEQSTGDAPDSRHRHRRQVFHRTSARSDYSLSYF